MIIIFNFSGIVFIQCCISDYMAKTTIDFKATFRSSFCLGSVTNIDLEGKSVTVDRISQEEPLIIEYTDLVIAVGTNGPFPSKVFSQKADDAAKQYKELGNEVDIKSLIGPNLI